MKVCKVCGNTDNDDSEFCSKCGEYYKASEAQPAAAQVASNDGRDLSAVVARLIGELKADPSMDEARYKEIVSECMDAVFCTASKMGARSRSAIADLAIMVDDYDLITDLLAAIAERSQRIGYQMELMNVATEYVFISIEAFAVYTDLNDLKTVCYNAVSVLDSMASRIGSLEPATLKHQPADYVDSYVGFFKLLDARVESMISSCTPERIEFLSDYWSEKSGKVFTDALLAAANMNIQLIAAGKLASKVVTKARDVQLDGFQRSFMAPKE